MPAILALAALLTLVGLPAAAQPERSDPPHAHVAVESTILTLDEARTGRLGLRAIRIGGAGAGHPAGSVRIGTRVGDLPVAAFLDVVRRERAVRSESTQRIVTLSGSAAEVGSRQTLVGIHGGSASAGPTLYVEPTALATGEIRLRVWTSVAEVRAGAFGSVWEEIPVEARTEIVVPDGTPVVIAATETATHETRRGILSRGSHEAATQGWVVVTARIVERPADAFPIPERLREGRTPAH